MALIPSIALSNSTDLSKINVVDVTGLYDASINPQGYGTPNLALSAVAAAVLLCDGITAQASGYYAPSGAPFVPFSATFIELYPSPVVPPFLLNELYTLTPAMLNMAGPNFPDGLYVFSYSIEDASSNFYNAVPVNYFFTGNAFCCIQKALLKYGADYCGCAGVKDAYFYKNFLSAAISAAGCLKIQEALQMLYEISQWCSSQGCSCN